LHYFKEKFRPVTAIFASNDQTAHGVRKGLRDSGLSIPDHVSVVGCDDAVGSWLYPTLTTTRGFPEQLGKQMVEPLLNRIANPGLEPQQITVPTELIKRDSCRPIQPSDEIAAGAVASNQNRLVWWVQSHREHIANTEGNDHDK
jgi:DNA-binding LacI/PurR family transcriptional regulator